MMVEMSVRLRTPLSPIRFLARSVGPALTVGAPVIGASARLNGQAVRRTLTRMFTTGKAPRFRPAILASMSGSLHPKLIHRRQHRREKRHKLRAQLGAMPAIGRAAI